MKDTDLITALRKLNVNTKGLFCLDCDYKDKCRTKSCRIIGFAADRLESYEQAIETIKTMQKAARGSRRSLLNNVLSLFDIWYGKPPEIPSMVYDFEICTNRVDLIAALDSINRNQWELISVTYGPIGFTLFFRRPVRE